MEAQTIKQFADLVISVRKGLDQYLLDGDLPGVACAAGTLTSRINNLKTIVAAFDEREPNDKDRFELSSLASTLDWLSKDKDVARDFAGLKLVLPPTEFNASYPEVGIPGEIDSVAALIMLRSALIEIVLEGKSLPLSA